MRERERLVQPVVGQAQHAENLAGVQPGTAVKHLTAGFVEDVVGHVSSSWLGAPRCGYGVGAHGYSGSLAPLLLRCRRVTSL